ncbi:MAG: glutathione S-transferase N-terminal domain-containing protein [Alphaproteobacteria bacterium]|nr:glutathione S-transferase N-terminal domain-containing protein [Alphaproteobacteria bacterium]
MYDLYAWPTPNGYKISILLEELGQPYNVVAVDIGAGDQFKPEFLAISPNNKMPALVDSEGPGGKPLAIFESGAIMMYLAEKHGRFWPQDVRGKYDVAQWLMFQMASVGPMLGQAGHFHNYAPEPIPYALDRYTNEGKRIYGVLDRKLATSSCLAGAYSIADMAVFPWLRFPERQGLSMDDFPHLHRWREEIAARPAVKKGLELLAERRRVGPPDAKQKEVLFGATQYQRR